ncbi:MAG: hypothetical protein HY208_08905, partial [Nitrospirae bacterium]|nr:hypothetical protein [Nitrospirota bacterium]
MMTNRKPQPPPESGPNAPTAPESTNDQVRERLRKLAELRALGLDPYSGRLIPTHEAAAIHAQYDAHTAGQLVA